MIEEKEAHAAIPFAVSELLNKVTLGTLIIRERPAAVIFSNRQFSRMARGKETDIINNVFKEVESGCRCGEKPHLRCDMEIEKGFVVGYTIYRLSDRDYLVFLSDISYKKIYLETNDENRFYDRLANIISELVHEIGNPLTSVSTTLQVLNKGVDYWDIDKKREYIQRAINEIERLSKYLQKMRDFSSLEVPIEKKPVYLKPVIDRVIIQTKEMLDSKNISVSCTVDRSIVVLVDEDAFYQVLLNFFLNSLEILSYQGKICIEVEEINEFFVKLIYKNNGPPIPGEMMEKIFMPFYTTKKAGRGIGLAVSLKLMTRMRGKIRVEIPEEGWGAKFVLYIPVNE